MPSSTSLFFCIVASTAEIYTLSLHDALPISVDPLAEQGRGLTSPNPMVGAVVAAPRDRKSTRLNSSHRTISYAVFCLKKKRKPSQDYEARGPHRPSRRASAHALRLMRPSPSS